MNKESYFIVRIAIAISMFGHGVVRLPKLQDFAEGMSQQFAGSMLPGFLVFPFGYILPLAELVVGALLLVGLYTRISAWAGTLVMFALLLGSCLIEQFGALPSQLIHTLFFVLLIQFQDADEWSLDWKLGIGNKLEK